MRSISANNKTYVISEHAAQRMLWRNISEAWVIETLEHGDMMTQPHGTDLYEYQIENDEYNLTIIVQVVVNESRLLIVSVIDDTEPQSE